MKYSLATTSIESTWNIDGKILFLGNWCLKPSLEDNWEKLDFEVLPYHWNSTKKLKDDEVFLENIYGNILDELVGILNDQHGLNWDKRSWSIIVGVWLRRYLTILYDRYSLIHGALEKFDIQSVCCGSVEHCQLTPLDRNMFSESYKSDRWNYYLFSRILRDTTKIHILDHDINEDMTDVDVEKNSITIYSIFKMLAKSFLKSRIIQNIFSICSSRNSYYLYLPYIPRKVDEILLNLKLGNFPLYFKPDEPEVDFILNKDVRNKIEIKSPSETKFEAYLKELLPEFIPVVYLEKFNEILEEESKSKFPKNIKLIFTTIGIYTNDVFKVWVVKQILKGSKLVVAQHGGHYATFDIKSESLPFELFVSDYYFSWGWKLPGESIKPIPALISINKKISRTSNKLFYTIITRPISKYCYIHSTGSLPGKKNELYLGMLFELTQKLLESHKSKVLVRLHPGESNEEEQEVPLGPQLIQNFPSLNFSSSTQSMLEVYDQSILNIFTYDGTSFLQSMALDVPCILISDPKTDPFSELARPFYHRLQEAGIYHTNVDSAYAHILLVTENIDTWWDSQNVQNARKVYCEMFTRISDTPLDDIVEALKESF